MRKMIWFLEFSFRVIVVLLISLGIFGVLGTLSYQLRLILFLTSGVFSGLYYGYNNDVLWHGGRNSQIKYNVHLLWIHVVCGVVAAISLHLLSASINLLEPGSTLENLKPEVNFILFLISLLGYTGLLPRTLWFVAQKGDIKLN